MRAQCPRDRAALEPARMGSHAVLACPACKGLWLPGVLVDQVVGRNRFGAELRGRRLRPSALVCPDDGEPMKVRVQWKIEMDLCLACDGLWLDAGELQKIRLRGAVRPERVSSGSRADGTSWTTELLEGVGEFVVEVVIDGIGSLLDGV